MKRKRGQFIEDEHVTRQRKKIEEIRGEMETRDKQRGDLELKVKALEEQVGQPQAGRHGGCGLGV